MAYCLWTNNVFFGRNNFVPFNSPKTQWIEYRDAMVTGEALSCDWFLQMPRVFILRLLAIPGFGAMKKCIRMRYLTVQNLILQNNWLIGSIFHWCFCKQLCTSGSGRRPPCGSSTVWQALWPLDWPMRVSGAIRATRKATSWVRWIPFGNSGCSINGWRQFQYISILAIFQLKYFGSYSHETDSQ